MYTVVFSLQESGLSRWVGGSGLVVYTVVFSLQESGLSRWVGERFSGVHGGVLVAGVGPVAVGGWGAV